MIKSKQESCNCRNNRVICVELITHEDNFIYMKKFLINEEITATKVRLIDDKKNEVLDIQSALQFAYDNGVDLVQVNEDEIPVVKATNSKDLIYKLKQEKKANDKKQRSNIVQTKEIQFSTDTDSADLNVKLKHAQRFLSEKKNVKIVLKIKGRFGANKELVNSAEQKLRTFMSSLPKNEVVQNISLQKNTMVCVVKPA